MARKKSTNPKRPNRLWPWALMAILALTAFVRFRYLEFPMERDEGEYAYAGQLILQGVPPYKLAYNMKLPGTYAFYALIMAIFGETTPGIHLGFLLLNLCTIIFVFLLGRNLMNEAAGVIAAGTYALMSLSPSVNGMSAHATHFVMFFALPGLLLLLNSIQSGRLLRFFLSGLLFGTGFLMKQPGIAFCMFAVGYLALTHWRGATLRSKTFFKRAGVLIAGMALPFVMTAAVFAAAGLFDKFYFWTFTYAKTYGTLLPIGEGFSLLLFYFKIQPISIPFLWLLGLAGAVMLFVWKPAGPDRQFMVGFFLFSLLAVSAGLYFRQHYFVFALPALSLLIAAVFFCGWQWRRAGDGTRSVWVVSSIALAAGGALMLFTHFDVFFQVSPQTASATFHDGNPFLRTPEVAEYIRKHSTESDTVAVLGSEPQIYFQARRRSATGYIYVYPLMEVHPHARRMQQEMIEEIEAAKPKFIVVVSHRYSWLPYSNSERLIVSWMHDYTRNFYTLVAAGADDPALRPDADSMLTSKNTIFIFERRSS